MNDARNREALGNSERLRIGTAGWSIPFACKVRVGGQGSQLERYARALNAAEINTSFYRPHRRATYEKWALATPPGFRFAVKVPQTISHASTFDAGDLDRFIDESAGLGNKLSIFLIQFPPTKAFDRKEAQALFGAIRKRTAIALVCEPRHGSWFTQEVETWLLHNRISRVAADPRRAPKADEPGGRRDLRYFRLHGSPRTYYSAYDEQFLKRLALRLIEPTRGDAWCIFDNTAAGAALQNALQLLDLPAAAARSTDRPAQKRRPSLRRE
jgi:uncharacterized protein YecE (DUF72 family)